MSAGKDSTLQTRDELIRELSRTNREISLVLDSISELLALQDQELRVLWANRAAAESVGQTVPELIGRHCYEIWHRRTEPCEGCPIVAAYKLGCDQHAEITTPDNRTFELHAYLVRDEEQRVLGAVEMGADITARRRAEDALRTSEERLELALNAVSDGVWDWDVQAGTFQRSEEWYALTGYTPEELASWEEQQGSIIHPDDYDKIHAQVKRHLAGESERYRAEFRIRHQSGEWRWILGRGRVVERDDAGRALRMIGTDTDITQRKNLESQLRQSQKMEAVGQLAGGVAHDFNNVLTAILGNVELLRSSLRGQMPSEDPAFDNLNQIEQAGQRAAVLTRQLLAFSRKQLLKPVPVDLAQTLRDMEKMLQRIIREDIALRLTCPEDLWQVEADPGQIEQIVLNLVLNARDAMPEGGEIELALANVTLDEGHCAEHVDAGPGPHAVLTVRDTGCGMDAGIRQHIFEPFFTTKAVGEGTGLGLATVHGAVRQLRGHITVESETGQGTCFRIYLPAIAARRSVRPVDVVHPPAGGNETVLLCEDDAAVRQLAAQALARSGYEILVASRPEESLTIARDHAGTIDLLVTDVIMPGMNGRQLAETLTSASPGLAVLYISGYAASVIGLDGALGPDTQFLQKPFKPVDLLRRVRQVLDARHARRADIGTAD